MAAGAEQGRDHRRRPRPRGGAPRRRHGPVGDPLCGARGTADRPRVPLRRLGQRRDGRARGDGGAGRACPLPAADPGGLRAGRGSRRRGRSSRERCRSCSAATTPLRSARSAASRTRTGLAACSGSTRTATSTRRRPRRRETCTGCRSPPPSALTDGRFESEALTLPALDPARVALVGLRAVDARERDRIREIGIATYTMSDIDRIGIERVIRESLARIAGPGFVHVSLDMDALDPEVAPGVGTPVRGGLLLPRGAPRARARRRVGPRRLARGRRGESDPRPRERDRASSPSSSSRARSARRSSSGARVTSETPGRTYSPSRRYLSKRSRAASSTSARVRSSRSPSVCRRLAASPVTKRRYSLPARRTDLELDLLDADRLEAGAADELLDPGRLAERELAGLARLRRLHQPALEQDGPEDGRPRVPLRGRPGREGEPPVGPEDAARLAEGERRIRGDHVAEPADDGVDARVRQVDRLHVHHADLDALEAAAAAHRLHHRGREVRRRQPRNARREQLGQLARAAGELEHRVLRARRERREERRGHGRVDARDRVAMLLPAAGRRVPAFPAFGIRCQAAATPSPGRTAAGSRRRRPAAPLPARASSGRC